SPQVAAGRARVSGVARRLPRIGAAEGVLAALIVVVAVWRSFLALDVRVPWVLPDEAAYALLGRAFWEHGQLSILGAATPFFSAVYPVLAGIPLELFGLDTGGDVLRVVQALALCSTAVVVYAWARSLVGSGWALAGAALTLALPGFVYAGTVTPDALLVPLATCALWQAVRTLEAPAHANQALLV